MLPNNKSHSLCQALNNFFIYRGINAISLSKDNEAARRRRRRRICTYVEETDDTANKVSQRKRNGVMWFLEQTV